MTPVWTGVPYAADTTWGRETVITKLGESLDRLAGCIVLMEWAARHRAALRATSTHLRPEKDRLQARGSLPTTERTWARSSMSSWGSPGQGGVPRFRCPPGPPGPLRPCPAPSAAARGRATTRQKRLTRPRLLGALSGSRSTCQLPRLARAARCARCSTFQR